MRKYSSNIKVLALSALSFCLFACNDDFMDRPPKDDIVSENFWNTETDLELYLNGMYRIYARGHNQDPYVAPLNFRGSHIAYDDAFSDNAVRSGQNVNVRLTNAYTVPLNDSYNGWSWGDLRRVNYFLTNYDRAPITEDKKKAYAAEAYFFKAWDYFKKVQIFSDVPWLSRDLNIDSEELYAPRDSRELVMDSVLFCINRAIEWFPEVTTPNSVGRINKDMAQFLKARICLNEGTFRKYHTELNLQNTAAMWLEEAAKAADYLIKSGRYKLFDNGNKDSYWALFAQFDAEIRSNPEAILGVEYSFDNKIGNDLLRYYDQNNHMGICAQKSLVDEYLCEDGRPIYLSGSKGNYDANPLFEGYGKWSELNNRDPRMSQTICKPGEYITIWNRNTGVYGIKENGITYPDLKYLGREQSGYRFIKHWKPDLVNYQRASGSTQSAIEFRYAEALLMYAEAKCELGTISQNDIDITINVLRQRAGFDFDKYPTARLDMGNIPADPRLDAVYREKLDYTVSPLLREIRRERRIEMAQEDLRYWDLMRWKAAGLLTVPMRGVKFTEEVQELYSGDYNNGVVDPETGIRETAVTAIVDKDVFLDEEGFIILHPKSTNIQSGTLPWSDYRYYWPIPKGELLLNTNLLQTKGWEDK